MLIKKPPQFITRRVESNRFRQAMAVPASAVERNTSALLQNKYDYLQLARFSQS
ncbi:hypothetical protein HMPREF0758_1013 [Serratia odorifera DSM 4582]|uniref:Uncharacterized protein n=1 Tax=Serratia odorifera DSM 4582 TaxID=667129 RepID=D4DYL3_SEROD|nr:hypothetical protein HMPREF0758_1013 [Serratia odorifera DSM 4582]